MAATSPESDAGMTFWDHLEVLRWSLFHVAIALVIAMIASFAVMPWVFDHIVMAPTTSDFFLYHALSSIGGLSWMPDFSNQSFHVDIININVASQFMTHLSSSFWMAFLIVFPYLIWELWKFIRPALYPNEKKSIGGGFLLGALLFYLGCTVGYSVVFPFTFRFLAEYQISTAITNQISLNSYMGTFMMMILMMGLVFELPMLALLLSSLGIVKKRLLREGRKYAVVVLLVLAAVITPTGDPFTLMVVFLPLYLLYEVSILIVKA